MTCVQSLVVSSAILVACGTSTSAPTPHGTSPLAEVLGEQANRISFDALNFAKSQRDIEHEIQECMAAKGFSYTQSRIPVASFASERERDRSYAEIHGYGVVETFERQIPQIVAEITAETHREELKGLSDLEQEGWEIALRGEQPIFDSASGQALDPETLEPDNEQSARLPKGGCLMEATERVYRFEATVLPLVEEMNAAINADPRMIDATDTWSRCMAEEGYGFSQMSAPVANVVSSLDPIFLDLPAADEDWIQFPQPHHQIILDRALASEQRLALADYDCRLPVAAVLAVVRSEQEALLVNTHRTTLENAVTEAES